MEVPVGIVATTKRADRVSEALSVGKGLARCRERALNLRSRHGLVEIQKPLREKSGSTLFRLLHTILVKCLNEHLGNLPGFTTFDLIAFEHKDKFTVTEKGH